MQGRLAIFLTIVVLLVVLIALNAASYVRVEEEADSEFSPNRSSTNAGATGTRALYDFLAQSGYKVVRWSDPPSTLLGKDALKPATLVVIGRIRTEFKEDETQAIRLWVEQGGRLVMIDRQPDSQLLPVSGRWQVTPELFDYPDPGVRPEEPENMTAGIEPVVPAQPTLLTRDVEQVAPSRFAARLHINPVAQEHAQENVPVGGANKDEPPRVADERRAAHAPVEHIRDGREGEGALLVDYAYGRGRIVVLSDPFIVANGGISRADNLQLAVNVVSGAMPEGIIAFDEYHQGLGATRNRTLSYFAGTPVVGIFAQAAFIIAAVMWSRGRRFARPLPAPRVDRRSNLEFVASMAELQHRAHAYDLAVENVYTRTRRALARYGAAPATASYREIAARVSARSGREGARIESLMRECEDTIAGEPTTARKTLALIARLRELERDLGIRMRAREIRQAEKR